MAFANVAQEKLPTAAQSGGVRLYRAAGLALVLMIACAVTDIGLTFLGGDAGVGRLSAPEWFASLRENWFLALRNLGVFNVINLVLFLPVYVAAWQLHRKTQPGLAVLVLALFVLSAAVYQANNPALAMLSLSQRYAAATTEAQQSLLAAAGTAVMAQGEDFTPGSFLGFLLTNLAGIALMLLTLRGRVFARWMGWVGLAGEVLLLVFTVLVSFSAALFDTAMLFAMLGGLAMLVWEGAAARRLLQMG